jgi:hypothetical protein
MNTFVNKTTDDICAEAQKAAWLYDDINDACPYPFGTVAAATFRAAFEAAKASMAATVVLLDRKVGMA